MYISEEESEIYNIVLTRAEIKKGDFFEEFRQQLLEKKADICRARIPVSNSCFMEQLESSGLWFSLSNINFKNKITIPSSINLDKFSDYTVEIVATISPEIHEIVEDIYNQRGWVNYSSLIGGLFFPKDSEKQAVMKWVDGYTCKPGHFLWALKYKNDLVGIYMGHDSGEDFYGDLYGINSKHRGAGHSKAIYAFMISWCKQNGYNHFVNDIGIANLYSQKSAVTLGLAPEDTYLYVEVFPFLSLFEKNKSVLELKGKNDLFSIINDKFSNLCETKRVTTVDYRPEAEVHQISSWYADIYADIKETGTTKIIAVATLDGNSVIQMSYGLLKNISN